MPLSLQKIQQLLGNQNITVFSISEHTKASENYVEVTFLQDDGFEWIGLIPYYYRRTGLFIENEMDLAEYLIQIKPFFTKDAIFSWIENEKDIWATEFSTKTVTKPFFDVLSSLNWESNFPQNDNPQRRIQDIKELGYTLSTRRDGRKTERLLVPIPRGAQTGYETFSKFFRANAIYVLNAVNIYELSSANRAGLLPDHKFPEIRWNVDTREENLENKSDQEIKNKFQLLDNQRNQQKREACRKCFQTNKRPSLFGINFYYEGDENWANHIPKTGKDAEQGCVGCGWYDIEKWRDALNNHIK